MKLNIRLHDEDCPTGKLEEVDAKIIDYEYSKDFKIFVHKKGKFWYASEFYTGMSLSGQGFEKKQECIDIAINGFYGRNYGDYWVDKPIEQRIKFLQEEMIAENIKKYGYANKD